jgi:plastocyanin
MYPLAPGLSPDHSTDTAGTTPTPIPTQTTGMVATVPFPSAGTYPFYVTGHTGMSGVVQAK